MRSHRTVTFLAVALALVMGAGLSACGGDESSAKNDNQADSDGGSGGTGADSKGREGRAFDSTNDAVVKALSAALDVKDVKFDGSAVRLIMSKGSTEDATAWIPCGAAGAVLAKDENPILVYPDGELDCSKRYDD